ncbi:uncharacterized protein LOC134261879 [Saccostrea cucullata]|uniref:uncharacterized protein LOC134261879 n=1 Tax=Saccostrea cuccullata TaxID=36930 RepID=UPI002ED60B14
MSSYKWLDLGIQHLSESVFEGLCHILGSSEMVIMRREIMDFREMMINQVMRTREADRMMMSGSMKEGLRLEKSDVDTMFWPNDHIVILDLNKAQKYDLSRKTLILCDFSESPPGFGLLELLTPTHSECVKNACMRINDRLYISSSKYRQITCSEVIPNFKEHGPCGNGVIAGAEYDTALCFVCDFWPLPASKWIDRCHSWPHSYIVDEILRNGCHFVAIGHKLGKHADKEWRISFSLAEQKLIYSMNHCQFLTYGLLKLFLKDFKKELTIEEKLLCSYHMKTAVFWVIQQNIIPQWCPQNLLQCFWVCFKLILKWVYEGVCPNFFIPENNMFLSNIHGEAQKKLFLRLYKLYENGLVSLLHCQSIRSCLNSVLQNPRQPFNKDKNMLINRVLFDLNLFRELYLSDLPVDNLQSCIRFLNAVEKLIILPLTQNQVLILRRFTSHVLQNTVFAQCKLYTTSAVNKQAYMTNKTYSHMLKLAAKFGCISDMLFIAMFYYKTLRYKEALSVIEMTKVKLAQPYVINVTNIPINAVRYMFHESLGGQSWSSKIRYAVAWDISIYDTVYYMNELMPEQQSGSQSGYPVLSIPQLTCFCIYVLCANRRDLQ